VHAPSRDSGCIAGAGWPATGRIRHKCGYFSRGMLPFIYISVDLILPHCYDYFHLLAHYYYAFLLLSFVRLYRLISLAV